MRRREALMEEFSDSSPKKLLDDEDETSDFIEHKKSSSTKKKGVKKNSHNRTFSSSSTGSNGSNSGNVTFGYGKKHTRTQSSTSSTGSTGGGYQSSGIYDGDSSPVVTDNYESNKYSVSNSSFDKYKGISSRDMGKVHSMPAISESYENSSYSNDPRIGSMKSNYYEQARKRQNEENGPYILQVIADMLKYIYSSITETATAGGSKLTSAVSGMRKTSDTNPRIGGDFPSPEIYLEPEKKQILEQFKKYCSKKFDVDNEKHQKLLFSLYKCCTQKKTILTEGEHWKFLGFQNTKPETDFRGAGILGLRNLLYFSKHYKKRFKNFFGKCTNEISVTEDGTFTSYPFVIAGLNVTMLLLSFLGIGFQASKVHNVTAKKNFIDLLTSDRGKPVLEEEEDEEDEEDSTPVVTEGTLLSFDDIPEQKPKKKGINILEDEVSPVVWDNGSLSWDEPKSPVSTSKNSSASTSTKKLTVASSPVKTSQKSDKKKKPKAKTETHQFNLDLFNEMYVVGFTCLHREWHKTKATYFDFGRVLDNTRKHLEDLLELRFNSFENVKEFNQSLKN